MNPLELAQQAAEKGQNQTANFWLIFVLCLVGIAVFYAARYLVGRLEKQTDLLNGLFKEANEGRMKCAERFAESAEVIRECKSTIAECNRCMTRTNEHLTLLEKNL